MHISTKMKKELFEEIEIPEGVEVNIDGDLVTIKGPEGENKREFNFWRVGIEKKDGKIILGNKKSTKREKKMMNTLAAHIRNMIKGVQEKFEYKLKICSTHFPMKVESKGNEVIIKNFWGEKIDRKAKVPEGAEIKIDKEIITISSTSKEIAGRAATTLELATKIRNRDKRVFQDGIYIIEKAGKAI